MIKLYSTEVLSRYKVKHISTLSQGSDKKITIRCPTCGKLHDRYFKILASNGKFECQSCLLTRKNTKEKPLVGSKYNRWTLVQYSDTPDRAVFKCLCGTRREVGIYSVVSGNSKSCGCLHRDELSDRATILTKGAKYNMLTVLSEGAKTGFSKVVCECGNTKEVSNYELTSGGTKSCGCYLSVALKKYYKKNPGVQSGENHPNWKGGISGDRNRFMSTNEYKEWRTEVFRRDGYKCVCCGVNSNTLEAHHILPYASNENVRTDVSNGVTMCRKHHAEFHSTYGRVSIGKEELKEFMRGFKAK